MTVYFVLLAASAVAQDGTCPAGDLSCAADQSSADLVETSSISGFWPPTFETLPFLMALVAVVWIFLISRLPTQQTELDRQFEARRVQAVLDQIAQVCFEQKENQATRATYLDRKARHRRWHPPTHHPPLPRTLHTSIPARARSLRRACGAQLATPCPCSRPCACPRRAGTHMMQ